MTLLNSATLSAPHRILFLTGGAGALLSMLPWFLQLSGMPAFQAVPPFFAHSALMLFGIFPFFILGFIYTAGPRWLQVASPARRAWLPAWALLFTGLLLLAFGFMQSQDLAVAGGVVYLVGWAWGTAQHVRHLQKSPASDTLHARWVLAGFVAGALALLALIAWLLSDDPRYWTLMRDLALWGFLAPVYITVCHRMIPFFSSNVLTNYQPFRPSWALNALNTLCFLHIAFAASNAAHWAWLVDLPIALLAGLNVIRWRLFAARKVPLLFVMHVAHAWLFLAAALYAAQSLGLLLDRPLLGTAPAHALSIGFFTGMLLAFATRVTLGHSGRPLAWSAVAAFAFWSIQLLALARVGLGVWPHPHGMIAAAALWLIAFIAWCAYYLPIYVKPRADGQAG